MERIKFNINHDVKVKVTEYGYEVWLAHENKFVHFSGTIKPVTIEELKTRQDEDGYTEFQMWIKFKDSLCKHYPQLKEFVDKTLDFI